MASQREIYHRFDDLVTNLDQQSFFVDTVLRAHRQHPYLLPLALQLKHNIQIIQDDIPLIINNLDNEEGSRMLAHAYTLMRNTTTPVMEEYMDLMPMIISSPPALSPANSRGSSPGTSIGSSRSSLHSIGSENGGEDEFVSARQSPIQSPMVSRRSSI